MERKLFSRLLLILFGTTLGAQALHAEDIDLFYLNPYTVSSRPNVLIAIDNTANWGQSFAGSTKYAHEMAALAQVIQALDEDVFNIGVMLFTESGTASIKGAYVRSAIQLLTAQHKTELVNLFSPGMPNALHQLNDRGSNAKYAFSMYEAHLYYAGRAAYSGADSPKRDPAAFVGATTTYLSPVTHRCQNNFVIFISNGPPDSGENTQADDLLVAENGIEPGDPIALTPGHYSPNWADEFSRFNYTTDLSDLEGFQRIFTYTLEVGPSTSSNGPDLTALLKSMANQGDGRYFDATDATGLSEALTEIFLEIAAIDSVLVSSALPVSVNPRGTNLNEVYLGMFRADPLKKPRWFGNLKLYQLALDSATDSLFLADRNGLAVEDADGFITPTTQSFWTQDSTYWSFEPRGTPPSASDSPDGEVAEKGGAAQRLRNAWPTRNFYTCTGSCAAGSLLSGTPFRTDNAVISQAALGVSDRASRTNLIDWVRGADIQDENGNGNTTEVRPSVHGDVLHSGPAVINYNRDGSNADVVVFYGGNDGVFRAAAGGKADTRGNELWGFIPEEFFGRLKRLRANTTIGTTHGPKPYFADGGIGVYHLDANGDGRFIAADGDKVHLFIGMRRGGRLLYALDVSDPDNPRFLWKRADTSLGYAELGQTWSRPKVATINLNGSPTPVLIFGGGYDPAVDDQADPDAALASRSMGRGIFVVDATSGELIWQAGPSPIGATHNKLVVDMLYSIPSDVTVINRNHDSLGMIDRLYVGDTGGNVWRVDTADPDPSQWEVHKLAALGGLGSNRKFLFPPDVVYGEDAFGAYDAVLLGSGDREHPFDQTTVNRFYMLKDRRTGFSGTGQSTIVEIELYDATDNLIQVGTDAEKASAAISLAAARGWYVTLGGGEKVVGRAVTLNGSTFFNTHEPTPASQTSCGANLGKARNYVVSFKNATASMDLDGVAGLTTADRSREVLQGGLLPSPTPLTALFNGQRYEAVSSGISVLTVPGVFLDIRRRVFWYKEME